MIRPPITGPAALMILASRVLDSPLGGCLLCGGLFAATCLALVLWGAP